MYICPICNEGFSTEEKIRKHNLACWRRAHPDHRSTTPPQGETIITKNVNDDILNFFSSLKEVRNDSKN